MSLLHLTFPSQSLQFRTDVNVFIPDRLPEGRTLTDLPVIYLLHGLSGSREDWMLNTSLNRYVDQYKTVVVCPEGERGFYLDLPNGPAWFTYITEELPTLLATYLRIGQKRHQTFIGGDSMGGYGAARIFALKPDRYAGMAAFSAPLSIDMFGMTKEGDPAFFAEMTKALGQNPLTLYGTDMDPQRWLELIQERQAAQPGESSQLHFYCGTEDDFIHWNRLYAKQAKELDIEIRYSEGPGAHEFNYWDKSLENWLQAVNQIYFGKTSLQSEVPV